MIIRVSSNIIYRKFMKISARTIYMYREWGSEPMPRIKMEHRKVIRMIEAFSLIFHKHSNNGLQGLLVEFILPKFVKNSPKILSPFKFWRILGTDGLSFLLKFMDIIIPAAN